MTLSAETVPNLHQIVVWQQSHLCLPLLIDSFIKLPIFFSSFYNRYECLPLRSYETFGPFLRNNISYILFG